MPFVPCRKNLHICDVVFVPSCREQLPIPTHAFLASSNSNYHTVIRRMIVKKKAPTDMKAKRQHKNILGRGNAHQTSYQYRIIKAVAKVAKVVAIIIGAIIGLLMWAVLKPIYRGVGWLISILTLFAALYWLLTL